MSIINSIRIFTPNEYFFALTLIMFNVFSNNAHQTMITVADNDDYNKTDTMMKKIDNLSEKAMKTHQQLWGKEVSDLVETDPELILVFDNFAFDEILENSTLNEKLRVLLIMASTIASQSITEYKTFVNAALNIGVSPAQVKEVLYQSVPYVGISKVIDFVFVTNQIFKDRNISLPLENQSTTDPNTRFEKGYAKQKEIIGDVIESLYDNSPKDLLHIQHYLSANCFGDYVTRNGLDVKTRELVTLSFLIALGGTEGQIKGHIRGNANVGNNRQTLVDLMTQLLPYVGYPRTLNAINCLNEIMPLK